MRRCRWAVGELMVRYHDEEWGVPVHDDCRLFELLTLEGAQAGLSWQTILNKRENYRAAFDNFDFLAISRYRAARVKKLLADPGIVRNRLKIDSVIRNAKAVIAVREEFGSFDAYIWRLAGEPPVRQHTGKAVPARTAESDAMSRELKRRGFGFDGSTICYAFMQAAGMVNDHAPDCFRRLQITEERKYPLRSHPLPKPGRR
jgi:DNA-3-methyladenine glycosylase I